MVHNRLDVCLGLSEELLIKNGRCELELDQGRRKKPCQANMLSCMQECGKEGGRGRGSHEYKLIRPLRKSQPRRTDLASPSDGILALTTSVYLVAMEFSLLYVAMRVRRTVESESELPPHWIERDSLQSILMNFNIWDTSVT